MGCYLPLLAGVVLCTQASAADTPEASIGLLVPGARRILAEQLVEAFDGKLRDLGITLVTRWIEPFPARFSQQVELAQALTREHALRAVFWTDLESESELYAYVGEGPGGRIVARPALAGAAQPDARAEALSLIARSIARAVLAADNAPKEENPVHLLVGYSLRSLAPQHFLVHGVALELAYQWHWLELAGSYRVEPYVTVYHPDLYVVLRPHPAEIGGRAIWQHEGWSLDAGVALGLEHLAWTVVPRKNDTAAEETRSHWILSGSAQIGGLWHITELFGLRIESGVELPTKAPRLAFARPTGTETVARIYRARPWAAVLCQVGVF